MDTGALAIIMVFLIPIIAIIGGLALAALKILKRGSHRETRQRLEEETRMVQRMYREFSRLEERIEALETILIERERKEVNK